MARLNALAPYALLALLFAAAIVFRPLLPIDETRYATVAWEMWVRSDWLLPTLNFAPYHHKPPVLFWLINAAWAVFGVHRWAALIPIYIAAAGLIWTTQRLARALAPRAEALAPWLALGSLPFLACSTLLMFDLLLTTLIAGAYCMIWTQGRAPRPWQPVALGVLIGAACLTKGPVALLFVLPPLALYPLWRTEGGTPLPRFYLGAGATVLTALAVAAAWVVPVLAEAHGDGEFAFWLLWEQSAGRVQGSFGGAHAKPLWFYALVAPGLLLPWAFFPALWRGLRTPPPGEDAWRFVACVVAPALVAFTAIAGKQPHYILPLLPLALVSAGAALEAGGLSLAAARRIALAGAALFVLAHAVAAQTVLHRYDLAPFAAIYAASADRPWAFVRRYQGEITFLARAEKPLESINLDDLPAWLAAHPGGLALVRYTTPAEVAPFAPLCVREYKGRWMGVFAARPLQEGPK